MTNLHLGERVKRTIERAGDTVREAALKLEESEPNLYKKLKRQDLDTEFIRRVANAYKVAFTSFFTESQYNNLSQHGTINQVGEKNFSQYGSGDSQILQEKLNHCERENNLLREQIELYKKLVKQ